MKQSVLTMLALSFLFLGAISTAGAGEGPAIKDGANPTVLIETSGGKLELELFEDTAPNTVANFIQWAEAKKYDGTIFHRIIANFMIQGGDPKGDGTGGPGYIFPNEDREAKHKHDYGAISMANRGPNTNGCQFFIVTNKEGYHPLDGGYTVFGKVTKGFDELDKLGKTKTGRNDRPAEDVKIISVTVLQKQSHAYAVQNTTKE